MTSPSDHHALPGPRRAALRLALFAFLAYALLMAALIALVPQSTRQAFDQNNFHARAIERFARQLPALDLRDYESATTPLYHILLALFARLINPSLLALRLVGSLASAALVGLALFLAARRQADCSATFGAGLQPVRTSRASWLNAIALTLPLAGSVYIVSAGTSLLPDAAGWLSVLIALAIALSPRVGLNTMIAGGATLFVLVLTRQIHAWAGLPLVVSAWLGTHSSLPIPTLSLRTLATTDTTPAHSPSQARQALLRALVAAAACLPAAATLFFFLKLWGGLVPPAFQAKGSALTIKDVYTSVSGLSPATPAFLLALVAGFSPFFAGFLWGTLRRPAWLIPALIAAALGLVIALLPVGTYSVEAGRYSGLWGLFKRFPTVMDRSLPLAALAALGAAWLVVWWQATRPRDRLVLASALVAFTLAHSAQALVWQRYMEPFVLITMMLAASSLTPPVAAPAAPDHRHAHRLAWLGPCLLGGMQAGIALVSLRT